MIYLKITERLLCELKQKKKEYDDLQFLFNRIRKEHTESWQKLSETIKSISLSVFEEKTNRRIIDILEDGNKKIKNQLLNIKYYFWGCVCSAFLGAARDQELKQLFTDAINTIEFINKNEVKNESQK